jgi:NADH dehydrogenase
VIALGGVTSTFNLPGVADCTLPLKTLEDAGTLRNQVIATLELADIESDPVERKRLLTYVVIGGGYTGVETAGELIDFFRSITRFYRTVGFDDVSVVLIEGSQRLLPELPERMANYTKANLTRRGVTVILGEPVASADPRGIVLASGRRFESGTIVWSAGVRPAPLVSELPVEHARNGAIIVREDLSVPDRPGLWALGDCASIPNGRGGKYPPTAQHAIREGPIVANNIVATLRGRPTAVFRFASLGSMASLGARRGIAALPGNIVVTGFLAWIIWRGYYLSRLPGLDRKIRVALDWTLGLVFPRDIAELRVFTERAHLSAVHDAGLRPGLHTGEQLAYGRVAAAREAGKQA